MMDLLLNIANLSVYIVAFIISIYLMWSAYASMPTWGQMRLVGITFMLYQLFIALVYASIFFEAVNLFGFFFSFPFWLDYLFALIIAGMLWFIYNEASDRETFKGEKFFTYVGLSFPPFVTGTFKVLVALEIIKPVAQLFR